MLLKTNRFPFSIIKNIISREIIDSRGIPTLEVDIITEKGVFQSSVPSGASKRVNEAFELRDDNPDRYFTQGVLKAVSNVSNIIAPKLIGSELTDQYQIDKLLYEQLDGSQTEFGWDKANLGGNTILAVSLSIARAIAAQNDIPLYQYIAQLAKKQTSRYVIPVPHFNVLNGGRIAGNDLAMQEFTIIPTGASSFKEAIQMGSEVYHTLKSVIKHKYGIDATNVGQDGGFAPPIDDTKEALQLIEKAINIAGHTGKVQLGIDAAASEFFIDNVYDLDFKKEHKDEQKKLTSEQLAEKYSEYIKNNNLISIGDPFADTDWDAYLKFTAGEKIQVFGADLIATNPLLVRKGIDTKACNAILLKMNQIGSLSETITAALMCQNNDLSVIVGCRSGETEDSFIADLAVGLGSGQIKAGALCRSERCAKYNQILRIEEELGSRGVYAGTHFRNPRL